MYFRFSETDRQKLKRFPPIYTFDDLYVYECPVKLITADSQEIASACFLISETSIPYWPGAWINQPEWLVEGFKIYKSEHAKLIKNRATK